MRKAFPLTPDEAQREQDFLAAEAAQDAQEQAEKDDLPALLATARQAMATANTAFGADRGDAQAKAVYLAAKKRVRANRCSTWDGSIEQIPH